MNEAQKSYLNAITVLGDEHNANPTVFTNEILVHNYVSGAWYLLGALLAGSITYICLVYLKDRYESRALAAFWFLITLAALFFGVTTISNTYFSPRLVILEHLSTME